MFTEWLNAFEHPEWFLHSVWVSLPTCLLVGKFMFGDWDGFLYSLRMLIQPDLVSLFRGEWVEDWWETIKFILFLILCAAVVFGWYRGVVWWHVARHM
jgi:hypothetical protein